MEAIESQVLEAASEGPTPRLGVSREESPTHMHLQPHALQLVRPEAECHQVAEPIVPGSGEHQSRTAQPLGPDLALAQEHGQDSCGLVGKLEQQAGRFPSAEEEGHREVGAWQLMDQEGCRTQGAPQAKCGCRNLCRERGPGMRRVGGEEARPLPWAHLAHASPSAHVGPL